MADPLSSTDGAGREWTIYVCECGLDWMGGNSKYCPAGHAYKFTTVEVVPRERTRVLEEKARAFLGAYVKSDRTIRSGLDALDVAEAELRSSLAAVAVEDGGKGLGEETRSARPVPAGEGADVQVHLPALLADQFGISRSEGRRVLAQGGVRVNGWLVYPEEMDLPASKLAGAVVQLGKRREVRLPLNFMAAGTLAAEPPNEGERNL